MNDYALDISTKIQKEYKFSCSFIRRRRIQGIAQYGVPLNKDCPNNPHLDLIEEIADAIVYAERIIQEDRKGSAFVRLLQSTLVESLETLLSHMQEDTCLVP